MGFFSDLLRSFRPVAFDHPGLLWLLLLIPLLIAGYVFAMSRKNRKGMRFTNTSMLQAVLGKQSQWRRHLAFALALLSLITLTLAFAKPMGEALVPRERATIVVVIDVSLSMQAEDVEPNRLEAAQTAATEFVESLPDKYNVALVSMAGDTKVLVPPTQDHSAVKRRIAALELAESTAIGDGIATAMQALDDAPKDPNNPDADIPGAIVLLSDGESTTGQSPLQEAAAAGERGVPIYTIAYGTENGYVDLDGNREPVPVNHDQMREVAELSEGQYFAAATPEELAVVYGNIGSSLGYVTKFQEITARYAGLGLVFAVVAALGAISMAVRWP
ncbi:MAG TPA: VWA domain-containing protein [Candidatus Avipropionibacterium avicola]|uniref:VWA domain-containing protein n=1 Tax=Candidatus Avipropionibacterium avicola TaxID=2840701 RepID=A0A9D1KM31_9ACTN|nr:VWA domain-containing protein [Candidatus Avipropionibacterium avicola]